MDWQDFRHQRRATHPWRAMLAAALTGLLGFGSVSDCLSQQNPPFVVPATGIELFGGGPVAEFADPDPFRLAHSRLMNFQQALEDPAVVEEQQNAILPRPVTESPVARELDAAADVSPIETFGEAPPERTPQFLRSVTPLLARGQWQLDVGLVYSLQETHFPALFGANVARTDVRRRALFVPLALRYGLNRRTQLFLNAPVGWSDTELASVFGDEDQSSGGFGDITFGITRLLCQDNRCGWSLVGTVRGTAPAGGADNPLTLTDTGLGSGVWRVGGDLLVIQNLDPIILFYGGGYTYSFDRSFSGVDVQFGHQFLYNMGLGFAVNPNVTLSTAFLGSYISETQFNGISVPNTDQEPIQIRMAATIASCGRLVEPFVTFGLTETAPAAQFGIIYTY